MLSGTSLYVSKTFDPVLRHTDENGHCMQDVGVDNLPLVYLTLQAAYVCTGTYSMACHAV